MYDRKLQVLQFPLKPADETFPGTSESLNRELEALANEVGENSFIQILGQSTYTDVMSSNGQPMLVLTVEIHEWEDTAPEGGVSLPADVPSHLQDVIDSLPHDYVMPDGDVHSITAETPDMEVGE